MEEETSFHFVRKRLTVKMICGIFVVSCSTTQEKIVLGEKDSSLLGWVFQPRGQIQLSAIRLTHRRGANPKV
jgi:hypothetical protein